MASVLGTVLALAGTAAAQEQSTTGFGIGADILLNGPGGVTGTYDAGGFRIQGLIGFENTGGGSDFLIAGRGLVPVHRAAMADFSIGGGLGFELIDPDGAANDTTVVHIEATAQARAFIASNFALNFNLGLGIAVTEGDDPIGVGGFLNGGAGFTYFFY